MDGSREVLPELSVDPSKMVKVVDWADVILNAFGVGVGHDETRTLRTSRMSTDPELDRKEWNNGNAEIRRHQDDAGGSKPSVYYEGVGGWR